MVISCQATKMTNIVKYVLFYYSMLQSNLTTYFFLTNCAKLMLTGNLYKVYKKDVHLPNYEGCNESRE